MYFSRSGCSTTGWENHGGKFEQMYTRIIKKIHRLSAVWKIGSASESCEKEPAKIDNDLAN